MLIDWSNGLISMNDKGKIVQLQVEEVTAEVRLCQQKLDLSKEDRNYSQVLVAQLFVAEEVKQGTSKVHSPLL